MRIVVRALSCCILTAVPFLACGDSGNSHGVDDNTTQVWQFVLLDDQDQLYSTATADCLPGGACDAESWTLLQTATFGCTHKVDFAVQFSGDQVMLGTFHTTFDSNCSNTSTVGQGTGVANAAYPAATQASGTVTLNTTSPIGPSGGQTGWTAVRVQ